MIQGLNHVTLSTRDLERSFAFYRDVLGFRPLAKWTRGAYFLAGEETWVCLTLDARTRDAPLPEYSHIAFSVTPDRFAEATQRIRAAGAAEWQANVSEGHSLYFLDPDDHKIEIHLGDWRTRLEACRERPYDGMVFFSADSEEDPTI